MGNNSTLRALASPYVAAIWQHSQIYPDATDHNVIFTQALRGNLDISRLNKALERFINETFILSATLQKLDDGLCWVGCSAPVSQPLCMFNQSSTAEGLKQSCLIPFRLAHDRLCRFYLRQLGSSSFELTMVLHHAVIDGASVQEFFELLSNYYNNSDFKQDSSLAAQAESIHCLSEQFYQKINDDNASHDFWKKKLGHLEKNTQFPVLNREQQVDVSQVAELYFELPKKITARLKTFCRNNDATVFQVLASVWYVLMFRYCDDENIAIHYPVHLKEYRGFTLGAGINSLIYAPTTDADMIFSELLDQIKDSFNFLKHHSKEYKYLPVNEVLKNSTLSSLDISIAETSLKSETLSFKGISAVPANTLSADIGPSSILLLYERSTTNDISRCCIKYRESTLTRAQAKILADHFTCLLEKFLLDTDANVFNVCFLSDQELAFIQKKQFSEITINADVMISDMFSAIVAKHPDYTAVIFKDKKYSYKELDEYSNALISVIEARLVAEGLFLNKPPIPILFSRGIEMIVTILALMKMGCAYVPIKSTGGATKVKDVLRLLNSPFVLSDPQHADVLNNNEIPRLVISIDDLDGVGVAASNYHAAIDDLAYILFTSGTTGKPKGVAIEQRGLAQRIAAMMDIASIGAGDIYLFKTSYRFDVSFSDIFQTLCSGATLLITEKCFDVKEMSRLVKMYCPTITHLVPSQVALLSNKINLSLFRVINLSGEAVSTSVLSQFNFSNTKIVNYYGPTETGECSFRVVKNVEDLSIGTPLPGFSLKVKDQWGNTLPMTVPGRLYISGDGVMRGYVTDSSTEFPEFNLKPKQCEFKTSDKVYYSYGGTLGYIGRLDSRIKLSGNFIDLDSVLSVALLNNQIKDARVVFDKEQGAVVLFYVSPKKISSKNIVEHLREKLPAASLPRRYIRVKEFPVLSNGKTDVSALLGVSASPSVAPEHYSAIEKQLHIMLVQHSCSESIGLHDNFPEFLTDSMSTIELVSKIESKFHMLLGLDVIYAHPTIARLARYIFRHEVNLLVRLNYKSTQNTLVMFHSALGGCEAYREFAQNLPISVFGVDSYALYYENRPGSFYGLCQFYADLLINSSLNLSGLTLGGWSFGGLLAAEVARLISKKHKINLPVVMWDTRTPDTYSRYMYVQENPDIRQMLRKQISARYFPGGNSLSKLLDAALYYHDLYLSAELNIYSGKVCLLVAGKDLGESLDNNQNDYGWRQYCEDLKITSVDASHFSMFGGLPVARLVESFFSLGVIEKDTVTEFLLQQD